MSETPLKGLKKFNTITLTDKISKNMGEAATFRRTQRKTISVLANPQSVMSTTVPIIDHNLSLPKIKTKRKQKKHGTYLQSWLDQALGSPDPFANQQQKQHLKDDFNILKTIRKYELDKRFLQSQNIPADKIQRLYQSLYIYSHGVNKVFEQLLEYIKQTENNDLLSNFWRAYTKLLQGSTSYQTVFQKVQKQHLQNIRGLKNSIETRTEMFAEQRKQFEKKIKQLQKIAEQKQNKLNHLKIQHDVLQSTLTLTDQAFNDQVNLRLKFEQKINAIYTTYEELKAKYTKIVEQMSIKNLDIIDRDNVQNQLKNKLLVQRTKVDELMFLLKAQKDKTSERQSELLIKNQQLEDARALLASKQNQQDTKHDTMQQHLSTMKSLKAKQIETGNVIAGQKITIRQQQQHIKKISQSLDEYKLHNNQLYDKYAVSGKKIVALQSNIEALSIKVSDLQNQVQSKSIQIADLNRQLSHTKGERDNLRHELDVSVKNLRDTRDTMTKNNVILEDLKAVKDKYERINEILRDQLKQLQTAYNNATRELSQKIQEFEGMKLLLDSRDKTIMQYQKNMDQQKQLSKGKITALNNTISKKQNLVLQYQKKKQQNQKEVGNLKSALKAAEDKNIIMESERLKLQIQLNGKIKILADLENVLNSENKKYYQLNQKLQGQLKQKSNINSKLMTTQFVLKTKNEEQRVQILSLSSLLSQYKNKLISRAQHIHPMVYQDALQIARRCSLNEVKAKQRLMDYEKQVAIYIQTNKKLEILAAQQKAKIQFYEQKMSKQAKQKVKMNQRLNKLEQSLKSTTNLYENEKDANRLNSEMLEKKKKIQTQQKQKIRQLETLSTNLRIKNEQLSHQIGKMAKQRELKKETKKQVRNQQIQTEEQTKEVLQIQKIDQQAQTEVEQIEHRQLTTELMRPIYEETKQIQQQSIKKQTLPQKKVQNKDFKKALKLTYMRR